MTARIAVALCTRDGAAWIGDQLKSIASQELPVASVVVSDDASADGTPEIAEQTMARIGLAGVVMRNPTALGVRANFEQALIAASADADLVALSDQDDVWRPDKTRRLVAEMEAGAMLVASDARLVDERGRPLGETLFRSVGVTDERLDVIRRGGAFDALLRRNLVTGATALARADLVRAALPIPDGWIHDEWLAIVAAAHDGIAMVPDALVDYRQHAGNAIGARESGFADRLGRLLEPRTQRNARLLLRAESLAARMPAIAPARGPLVDAKLAHEQRRSRLSPHRVLRVAPIVAGLVAGDYRRFGNGVVDAVRDVVQRA